MTQEIINLTFEQWVNKYEPTLRHDGDPDGAPYGGFMWETYGSDLDHVKKQRLDCIWTLTDTDGELLLTNGYHFVNRMGYVITAKPFNPDHIIQVGE